MIVILVNGPPGSGKDTIGELVQQQFCSFVHMEKFAMPIKHAVRMTYNIPMSRWREMDTLENKGLKHSELHGKTPREVQIRFSEDWLKQLHDSAILGKLLVDRLKYIKDREAVVVTDSGFLPEAEIIVGHYEPVNVFLWNRS